MQMGVGIRQSVADVDTDSLLSQNWPPSPPVRWRSCSETDSATTEKHGRKKTEKTARNATEFLISIDLGKVWLPLIGGECFGLFFPLFTFMCTSYFGLALAVLSLEPTVQ